MSLQIFIEDRSERLSPQEVIRRLRLGWRQALHSKSPRWACCSQPPMALTSALPPMATRRRLPCFNPPARYLYLRGWSGLIVIAPSTRRCLFALCALFAMMRWRRSCRLLSSVQIRPAFCLAFDVCTPRQMPAPCSRAQGRIHNPGPNTQIGISQ